MNRAEFIRKQLEWLNANGQLITSCSLTFENTTIMFSKNDDVWCYSIPSVEA